LLAKGPGNQLLVRIGSGGRFEAFQPLGDGCQKGEVLSRSFVAQREHHLRESERRAIRGVVKAVLGQHDVGDDRLSLAQEPLLVLVGKQQKHQQAECQAASDACHSHSDPGPGGHQALPPPRATSAG
jgi:hypothetical protein